MFFKKILCFSFAFISLSAYSTKRYWVGNGSNINWNSTVNWSAISGGSSGASVPASTDTAYFDSNSDGKCSLNINVGLRRLELTSDFLDTIHQGSSTFSVGTGGAIVLSGGVFWGGSGTITINSTFTLSGAVFRSTSGLLKIFGDYTFSSGAFLHNNGEVHFAQHSDIEGSTSFYDLTFNPANSGAYNIGSSSILVCEHNLKTEGVGGIRINDGTIHAKGDIYQSSTYGNNASYFGGTGTIIINGIINQTFYGSSQENKGAFCNIQINKSSDTLFLKDFVNLGANWNYVSGFLNTTKYSSTVVFGGASGRTISGSHTLNNVSFNSSLTTSVNTIGSSDTITISGTLRTEGSYGLNIHSGVLKLKGDLIINNTYNNINGGGTGVICISGSGNQEIVGSTVAQNGRLCNIKINKSSGTLFLKNYITLADNSGWYLLNGNIDAETHTSTVIFTRGTRTISGNTNFYNLIFNSTGTTGTTNISSNDTLVVTGEFKIEGTNNVVLNSGRIKVKKDLIITNTSTGVTSSTATIEICGNSDQILTGSGAVLAGKLPKVIVNKNSGTLYLNSIITFIGDWNYIKGNVISGTSTIVSYGTPSYLTTKNSENIWELFNFRIANGNCTLNSDLKLSGDLTISTTLTSNSKKITIGGNWDNTGTFVYSGSTVVFNGSDKKGKVNQRIIRPSASVSFNNLVIEKDSGKIYLDIPTTIYGQLSLNAGDLVSTTTNLLTFVNGSSLNSEFSGNTNSFVVGPVKKVGNSIFQYPLGDTLQGNGCFHPLSITAPSLVTDAFTASYYNGFSSTDTTVVDSIEICKTEYWTIARNVGSSNVLATIGWNSNNCLASNIYDMIVSGWDGAKWKSLEGSNIILNGNSGSVKSTFSPVWNGTNAVGITLGKKKAIVIGPTVVDPYCVSGQTTGSISHSINFGAPPFSYSWDHGPTTKDLAALNKGNYRLTITDRKGRSFIQNYSLDNCIIWNNLPSTLSLDNNGKLTKSSGGNDWENAIVESSKILDSIQTGEWIRFEITDTTSNYLIGFSSVKSDSLSNDANLMLYVEGKNLILVETDNDGFYSKVSLGNVSINDVMKIELNDATGVNYSKNGNIIYTGKLLPASRLLLTANLNTANSKIKNIRCSSN